MKKLILMITMAVLGTSVFAQKIKANEVPSSVMQAFNKSYPTIKDVDWSKDGMNYEAEYDSKNGDKSVTYDANGTLLETEKDVKVTSLPAAIPAYLKKNHKDHKIKEASQITSANGVITYETEVNGIDLIFGSTGTYLRSRKN